MAVHDPGAYQTSHRAVATGPGMAPGNVGLLALLGESSLLVNVVGRPSGRLVA
jgi:hypothetical protein